MINKMKIKNIIEWIICIIIAVILALAIRYYIITPTVVKKSSMYPTLMENQRLLLSRIIRTTKEIPNRGDIITFEKPSKISYTADEIDKENPIAKYEYIPSNFIKKFSYYILEIGKESYIKRVIALPGEHVKIENGKVYINGTELEEPYLQPNVVTTVDAKNYNYFSEFTVPEGYVFAMGDNRSQSTDCRAFGCVPVEKVESKVWIRFWPLNLFGKV